MARDLRSIVRDIHDLPTLPQVVTRIMSMMDDPDTSAEDINNVLERDPSLVAKILKLVNSAFYGLPHKISSVRQAIVILGFSTVRSLAISAAVFDLFGETNEESFSRVRFWEHSIGVASVARMIGRREGGIDEETAFVAGLLHDLGKLVLDQYAPREFSEILRTARERKATFRDAEAAVLQATNHAEIGGWLAEQWRLPADLSGGIRNHHTVQEAEGLAARLASICSFSDFICLARGVGQSGNYSAPQLDAEAWSRLSIPKDELAGVVQSVGEELAKSETLLGTAVGPG
jgi:putative nucleotidyltransferase with HDIG domain